jgi:predicted dehydrogenase
MGGYYLAALINMLGPVERVSGVAQVRPRKFLNVKSPRFLEDVKLETPTNLTGTLEFASGALGSVTFQSESFMETSRLEIYGTEGTLLCPDPNTFRGPVRIIRRNHKTLDAFEFPLTHGYWEGENRGLGVADMAWAIINNRPHRVTTGYHVFEIIHGIWQSGESGSRYQMKSKPERPAALASGYTDKDIMETVLAI